MKTRTYSLPLVILAALLLGNTVSAQSVAQSPLFSYLEKIPDSPPFPDDAALLSTPPERFEEHAELNAMEKKIQAIISGLSEGLSAPTAQTQYATEHAPRASEVVMTNTNPSAKREADSMLATLQDMQSVEAEFRENFRVLENTFSKRIDHVYDISRTLQKEHPCDGNTGCLTEHARTLNSGIVAATRDKIKNEEYLLSVYLDRVKPSFKSLDSYLQTHAANLESGSKDMRSVVQGARQGEVNMLTDIIERLKLERITISNCARLAQQYQK